MHSLRLNVNDTIYEQFMGLIDILPKQSIQIEEVNEVPYYPSISFEEAQEKVSQAVNNIPNNQGIPSDKVFDELLS